MDQRTISCVSYITPIGWIVALIFYSNPSGKSSLTKFHLRQSLGLILTWFAIYIVDSALGMIEFPGLGLLFKILHLCVFVLWVLGLISAIQSEEKPVPVLGEFYQKIKIVN
jgi:uncharacterized membrane protein